MRPVHVPAVALPRPHLAQVKHTPVHAHICRRRLPDFRAHELSLPSFCFWSFHSVSFVLFFSLLDTRRASSATRRRLRTSSRSTFGAASFCRPSSRPGPPAWTTWPSCCPGSGSSPSRPSRSCTTTRSGRSVGSSWQLSPLAPRFCFGFPNSFSVLFLACKLMLRSGKKKSRKPCPLL